MDAKSKLRTISIEALAKRNPKLASAARFTLKHGYYDEHEINQEEPKTVKRIGFYMHGNGNEFIVPIYENTVFSINPLEKRADRVRLHLSRRSVGGTVNTRDNTVNSLGVFREIVF